MSQRLLFNIVFTSLTAGTGMCYAQAQENPANRATQFCLEQSTNRKVMDLAWDKPVCVGLKTAAAAAAYFSGNEEVANLVLNSTQRDWAIEAIRQACLPGDIGRQTAIRLIQACQCENPSAMDIIENNQDEVIRVLKVRSGRHSNYPGCENAPTQ